MNKHVCLNFCFDKVNIFSLCKQDASVQMSPFDNEEAVMKISQLVLCNLYAENNCDCFRYYVT